ncbi:MAG: glycine cleavage system aminomethyltransferase GcvT [Candidatus Heimdallarchaeota archaeon]|nr:glycine cleavage system aminomethyltransferase GcvT [Candidatus Heimdallarchaeota archaeon]
MPDKTVLYDSHVALGADMVDFAGFMMPVRYKTNIVEEHLAVRNNVGMFDTSHMGRYWITGSEAKQFLDFLVPRNIMKLQDGRSGYTFILNKDGGFKDDVIISQFSDEELMLVCNAGNRPKIWSWINAIASEWVKEGKNIKLEDRSKSSCMIAVQGPKAFPVLEEIFGSELPTNRFRVKWVDYKNEKYLFSTTGYTGSAGGEVIIFGDESDIQEKAEKFWNLLLEKQVIPCALGSRDTLRLEAGYRLYGNDLSEELHLLESGLDFYPFVDIEKETGYMGQQAVLEMQGKADKTVVAFKLLDRGIARHDYNVIIEGEERGKVLSGSQSPMTKESFGMALVPLSHKEIGSRFSIQIRKKFIEAKVIKLPIYDESKYGVNVITR